jgi:multicomponent Na+:H+ antiporter subunit D
MAMPLAPVVLLLGAAVIAAVARSRAVATAMAIGFAAAAAVILAITLFDAGHGIVVHWFGGWEPRQGVALGIDFAVDSFAAGLALFATILTILALVMLIRYRETDPPHLQAMLLVFCAGMTGFCLSGDLFNMFVFFELMGVAAYALTGFKARQEAAIEGSLTFAVTNTVGSIVMLVGIGLVYARAGALNLAAIGGALGSAPADGLVIVALTLIVCGLLVKAAMVPFQAWLADAYAVAPTPVCLLFAGAMSELGIYGVGRIWFDAFEPAFATDAAAIGDVLIVVGSITTLLGGAMCLAQDHLRRMLAFATVALGGSFLIGLGTLSVDGVGGAAMFIVADGMNKAALFGVVGILQHRAAEVAESRLHGFGRRMPLTGLLVLLGALALAAVPGFGAFEAKGLIEHALVESGRAWAIPALIVGPMLAAAAVLRMFARVFWGIGPAPRPSSATGSGGGGKEDADEDEEEGPRAETPASLFVPAALLTLGGLLIGLVPGVADGFVRGAAGFVDGEAYRAAVLAGTGGASVGGPVGTVATATSAYLLSALSLIGAVAIAAVALTGADGAGERLRRLAARAIAPLQAAHSGHIGDYVAWVVLGVAAIGGGFAIGAGFGG